MWYSILHKNRIIEADVVATFQNIVLTMKNGGGVYGFYTDINLHTRVIPIYKFSLNDGYSDILYE